MAITIHWDNAEQTVLRMDIESRSEWDEFSERVRTINEMIERVDHEVDLIVNAARGASPPPGALMKFRRAQERMPDNLGMMVIIESSLFGRSLFGAFTRVYPHLADGMRMAPSLEEARALIAERRAGVG